MHSVVPGAILAGKYRVNRVIGRGGMGLVVEARHLQLDTKVAIKLLFPEFMSYTEASERFLREARAASHLESQHVTRVLDVGTIGSGEPFMVMECLEGEDLSSFLKSAKGPLLIHDAVDFIVQACDAIAEAHEQGIVHRDVKPANLFVTIRSDGERLVKVLDFGISKIVGEGAQEGDVGLTQTTTILGSALYMSPEQMQSAKKVDQRTDIYALGVCLFELIAGEVPYYADSFPELCAKVYTSPPKSLRALRPDAPEGLVRVVERALAHRAENRYQRVTELLQALSPHARNDTRRLIETILKRRSSDLRILPPADESTARDAADEERAVKERKRSRFPLLFLMFLVLGGAASAFVFRAPIAGHLARLRGTTSAPTPAPIGPAPDVAPAIPTPVAVVPALTAQPVASAPAVSASASASTCREREVSPGTERERGSPTCDSDSANAHRTQRCGDPVPDRAFEQPDKTPAPRISQDLTVEECHATIDGVRKIVPCP